MTQVGTTICKHQLTKAMSPAWAKRRTGTRLEWGSFKVPPHWLSSPHFPQPYSQKAALRPCECGKACLLGAVSWLARTEHWETVRWPAWLSKVNHQSAYGVVSVQVTAPKQFAIPNDRLLPAVKSCHGKVGILNSLNCTQKSLFGSSGHIHI